MEVNNISASEIRDLLNKLYISQIIDIKNYGSVIEDLLKTMEKYPRIKWETKKVASFWYDRIPELHVYQDYLEGKKSLPLKGGKMKFRLRKKPKGEK